MKKFFTLLIVLTGFVSVASATVRVYIQPNDWAAANAVLKLNLNKDGSNWNAVLLENVLKEGIYYYDVDETQYNQFQLLRFDPNNPSTQWNYSGQLSINGSKYYMMGGVGDGSTSCTISTYLPEKYYLMSNASGSWKAVDVMTESAGVYSRSISAATYAGKKFAFAMGDAFAADGSFSDGTDYNNWLKVIRPVAESTQFNIGFANYAGSTITNTKDAGAALWFVEENNNCGEIIISYTPSSNSFSVACRHSVSISLAGYATYSNAYNYKVVGATAYTISSAGDRATLNSLGEGAEIPAGTGIIIAGSSTEYTVLPSNGTATIGSNLLIGSNNYSYNITGKYSEKSSYTAYIFADGTKGVGFYKLDESDNTLAAHKAFLAVPITNSSRSFIGFDDEVTAINAIGNDVNNTNAPIYNLQGVRLNRLQKGLNIVNGKKILVK